MAVDLVAAPAPAPLPTNASVSEALKAVLARLNATRPFNGTVDVADANDGSGGGASAQVKDGHFFFFFTPPFIYRSLHLCPCFVSSTYVHVERTNNAMA